MSLLLRILAIFPLRWLHATGVACARLVFYFSVGESRRLDENLRLAGYSDPVLRRAAIAETGKTFFEMPWLWSRPQAEVVKLVRSVEGEGFVREALAAGKGILFLTPHLGSFEVAGQYAASHMPVTAMYRTPKQSALDPIIRAGRGRGNIRLATADMQGVFALLRALKNGEGVGILPDQVPSKGQGEWADFFGRPAYTMVLTHRLQKSTGACVALAYCERLPRGEGYKVYLAPLPEEIPGESPARRLNRGIEQLIRKCPAQYLWSYNRYKVPAGASPPEPRT